MENETLTEEKQKELFEKYPPSNFNWWAFFFGIFYYFYKGLWKRGLGYFLLIFILSSFIPPTPITDIGIALAFALWWGFNFNKEYLKHNKIDVRS